MSTIQLTAGQREQVRRVIGQFLFDLGFNDDLTSELGAELDGPGPDRRQRKYVAWLGKRLEISARILESAERGELPRDAEVAGVLADCQLHAERTLDGDRGGDCGDREDPHAVKLAASHLAEVCAIRELVGAEAVAA